MQRGDLMDIAALIGQLDDVLGFLHREGLALAGVVEHVTYMAHEHAQILIQVAGALAHHAADTAALARSRAQMALIVFNVLVAALVVDLLRLGGNGCLHRDDAHDAGTHGGVGSMVDLAGGGVLLKGVGDLRMLDAELLVDEKELEDTGSVRRQEIDLQADFRDQDLHHHTDIGELMQDLLGLFLAHFGSSGDTGDK